MPCGTFNSGRKYQIGSELKKDIDNSIVAEGKISRDGKLPKTLPEVQDLVQEARTIPTEHQEKQREDRGSSVDQVDSRLGGRGVAVVDLEVVDVSDDLGREAQILA